MNLNDDFIKFLRNLFINADIYIGGSWATAQYFPEIGEPKDIDLFILTSGRPIARWLFLQILRWKFPEIVIGQPDHQGYYLIKDQYWFLMVSLSGKKYDLIFINDKNVYDLVHKKTSSELSKFYFVVGFSPEAGFSTEAGLCLAPNFSNNRIAKEIEATKQVLIDERNSSKAFIEKIEKRAKQLGFTVKLV